MKLGKTDTETQMEEKVRNDSFKQGEKKGEKAQID